MRAACPALAGLAALLALAGCGLEIVTYLLPPGVPTLASDATPLFELNYTLDNDQAEFSGFEVYYKFYNVGTPVQDNLSTFAGLTDAGYRPVCGQGDSETYHARPVMPVDPLDRAIAFKSLVDFDVLKLGEAGFLDYDVSDVTVTGRATIAIFRQADDGAGGLEEFRVADLSGDDEDLAAVWSQAQTDGMIVIAMYGLSFGWQGLSSPLYSPARYLGSTTIYLP